jgi:hypothetical protein
MDKRKVRQIAHDRYFKGWTWYLSVFLAIVAGMISWQTAEFIIIRGFYGAKAMQDGLHLINNCGDLSDGTYLPWYLAFLRVGIAIGIIGGTMFGTMYLFTRMRMADANVTFEDIEKESEEDPKENSN